MSPIILFSFLAGYFALLVGVSYITSCKSSGNTAFFIANRSAKWYVVAFGMVGTTLSGVTLISVPGAVGNSGFGYFQFVLGNAIGFLIVAGVLLPLYYRLGLVSIYTYLEKRFGYWSYKSGAMIFLISRTISSAFRLYIVVIVLQKYIFDAWSVPFVVTVATCLTLIWIYTHKGGLKTIIITDTLQTGFMLLAVVLSVYFIATSLGLDLPETFETVKQSSYTKMFFWEDFAPSRLHFAKQFLGGVFVAIAMNGLDQDIMQKNLSMKTIGEAQRNMVSFTVVFVCISFLFLLVGALLYGYVDQVAVGMAALETPDHLFPEIALHHLPTVAGVVFMIGLTAATFATTDSALTALTTSFCVDFLNFDKQKDPSATKLVQKRHIVHIGFSLVMLAVIWIFNLINDDSVVNAIFKAAGYTYGPLLGLFSFGILSKRAVRDRLTPFLCLLSPVLSFLLELGAQHWFGYATGFEVIIFNAAITYTLLFLTSRSLGNA